MPVAKIAGNEVYAGKTNQRGYLEVEVTKHAHDTTLVKIISLVEQAQSSRAPAQRFVEHFARWYTPLVLVMAVLVAIAPPLMGAAGSDTALETADIALMADDLDKLPYLLRLSHAAVGTIRSNIAFSLVVKVIFLALTLMGMANLWLAILADTGAALLVIANGMRLLRFREN